MYTSGEFSRITGFTNKMLRLYHEKEILIPRKIDQQTAYRFYDKGNLEQARIISHLKTMEFSLEQIHEIVTQFKDDSEIINFLETQRESLARKMENYKAVLTSIETIIENEKEYAMKLTNKDFIVQEKLVKNQLVATIRFKGRYDECGIAYGKIGKALGRYINGKPFNLYYDEGYQEQADIEAGFPVKQGQSQGEIQVKELAGGKVVSLIHKGPYDEIGRTYEKITDYMKKKGFKPQAPCREIYLKGPGMIFRGNPKNYLTEVQFIVKD